MDFGHSHKGKVCASGHLLLVTEATRHTQRGFDACNMRPASPVVCPVLRHYLTWSNLHLLSNRQKSQQMRHRLVCWPCKSVWVRTVQNARGVCSAIVINKTSAYCQACIWSFYLFQTAWSICHGKRCSFHIHQLQAGHYRLHGRQNGKLKHITSISCISRLKLTLIMYACKQLLMYLISLVSQSNFMCARLCMSSISAIMIWSWYHRMVIISMVCMCMPININVVATLQHLQSDPCTAIIL